MKKTYILLLCLSLLVITLCVGYYFVIALPSNNKEKLNFEKQKYEDQIKTAQTEQTNKNNQANADSLINQGNIAKSIQDDCIKKTAQSVSSDFSASTVTDNPLYYPYEDENSFNKNERLITSLSAYLSCITNDPRYVENNKVLHKIEFDGSSASYTISAYMASIKKKNPNICNSYLLSASAKKMCDGISARDMSQDPSLVFKDFNLRIDAARQVVYKPSDTELLETILIKYSWFSPQIDQYRQQGFNDTDILNEIAQKYSGKMPSVPSNP
jgi:hypothetical protein